MILSLGEVLAVLHETSQAWNRGDLEQFLTIYAEEANFHTGKDCAHGLEEIKAKYRRNFPSPEKMGVLKFWITYANGFASETTVTFTVQWSLTREATEFGQSLLVMRRRDGIIQILEDASF